MDKIDENFSKMHQVSFLSGNEKSNQVALSRWAEAIIGNPTPKTPVRSLKHRATIENKGPKPLPSPNTKK